jgi:hypothetical protein
MEEEKRERDERKTYVSVDHLRWAGAERQTFERKTLSSQDMGKACCRRL